MVTQLNAAGWPVLESMFSREVMLRRLQDGDLGRMQQRSNREVFYACAEALLLMDAGPSDALESRLRYALDHATHRENAERFDTWVRAEAAKGVTGDPLMPRPLGPADDGLSR